MPRRKVMHREKISYLAKIYASREDFIPRRNLRIVRRYSCPTRSHALPENEIVYPNGNVYPSASTAFFILIKVNIKGAWKTTSRETSALHQLSFMLISMNNILKITLQT